MEPDSQQPGRLSPDALFIVWLMAATFFIICGLVVAGYLTSLLSGR